MHLAKGSIVHMTHVNRCRVMLGNTKLHTAACFILLASDAPEMRNGFAMLPAVASRKTFS